MDRPEFQSTFFGEQSPGLDTLSPSIDVSDASSDDGETLHTPLTEHNEHHHSQTYDVYHSHQHFHGHNLLSPYTPHLDSLSSAKTNILLTPLSPFLAPAPAGELPNVPHDLFLSSFASPSHALDLANASLELTHFAPHYAGHSHNNELDAGASLYSLESFDQAPVVSHPSAHDPSSSCSSMAPLPPLPSLSLDNLCSFAAEEPSSLLLSAADHLAIVSDQMPLEPYDTQGRMYSPRFPAEHELNPFFVRTYCLGDELGAGGYGFVMTATHRVEGREVAVKFIIKEKVPEHAWWQDDVFGRVPTEVMILSLVNHEHIVRCIDLYEDNVYFYLVQELHGSPWVSRKKKGKQVSAPGKLIIPPLSTTPTLTPSPSVDSALSSGPRTPPQVCIQDVDVGAIASHDTLPISKYGLPEISEVDEKKTKALLKPEPRPNFSRRPSHDLFECIEQSKHKRLSESDARYIFAQVVEAVYYLDSQGITHCDIKDENLVIDHELKVKLIDFGSAVVVDPAAPRPYYTLFFGTTAYAASEILRKQPYSAPPAEIWTLGVLLSYLLTGHSPFPTEQDAIDGRIVLRESSRLGAGRLSRAAGALMERCLERDPERRADIHEVRAHRWLVGALDRRSRD